jgi:hypothetical protein
VTEEEAIQVARAFAKTNSVAWRPPITARRSTFRKKGWISMFCRDRNVWVVHTLSYPGMLGGGSASIHVDEKTGRVLMCNVYDE